ncbi:putative ribonuclease H-like domain-containing protein [Tanacetum coccineum]|uniref:Ribonuclease H-like domain-containing protein n=1 Tax=Tanacetum coccineum TaxID=301880 RepID=A0ABQ5EGF8_9ASTR
MLLVQSLCCQAWFIMCLYCLWELTTAMTIEGGSKKVNVDKGVFTHMDIILWAASWLRWVDGSIWEDSEVPSTKEPRINQEKSANVNTTNITNTASDGNSTNNVNIVSSTVNAVGLEDNVVDENIFYGCIDDPNMPNLEEIAYSNDDEEVGAEANMNNLAITMPVWTLMDLPHGKRAITKWVYRNKKDERGIVIRNKARLVAQGYTQEEGIDYDKVFALVSRIQAIRLFVAYASFKDFIVYQMDVKSAFLYGKIEEEVYVCQPPGFEDPEFPDKVYKVEKALYGLHQAPRAWYETLSTYLLDNGFPRGQIDKTLFIKRVKGDILLVQVYVDDIIFGSTKKGLCTDFEKLMHKKFQMSSMGELTFFLRQQVTQKDDGIFISQYKYMDEILKNFGFSTMKTTSTPMETSKPLLKDVEAKDVDVYLYRSMIGSLMYLTASTPDIMFAICACARFQVTPKVSHLHAVKRIFRYLKGQPKLGLWYPKDSPFDMEAYTDNDYVGASIDRKSPIGGCLEWNGIAAKDEIQVSVVRVTYYWKAKRTIEISQSSRPIPLVSDETVIKEWEDRMERAATTASTLTVGTGSGSGPRCQDIILEGTEAQIRFEAASKQSNDLPLSRVNTLGSREDSIKLKELMEFYTKLSVRALVFWATAKAKTVNRECQIQALVDKKKVIITEKSVGSDLMLEDAEGTKCLPNDVIFEYAKTTTLNEFSSTMTSVIICLATNRKFNFSKCIFDNMMKNLEGGVKCLMYPWFVQVFLDKQVEGMSKHKGIYVTPSHTKKIFANVKREGKKKSRRKQRKDIGPIESIPDEATNEGHVSTPSYDPPQSGEDRLQLTELMSLCTSLQEKEDASKQGRKIDDLDADEEVTLIDKTQERNDEDWMFDIDVLNGDEVFEEHIVNAAKTTAGEVVTTANATTIVDELTLAQTLIEIKAAKPKAVRIVATTITTVVASTRPKAKGIVFHDQEDQAPASTPIVSSPQASQLPQAKDKGKAKMVKPEKPSKKKDQIALDEELALRLHAKEQADLERMQKEKVA